MLATSLACGGLLPPDDGAPSDDGAVEAVADLPAGPWVFATVASDDGCTWQHLAPGAEPLALGQHDGACPVPWSLGVDAEGVPVAGYEDTNGRILVRTGRTIESLAPPPKGEPRRAGHLDGVLTVDTVYLAEDGGPPTFEGHTHSREVEGLPALALRWQHVDGAWKATAVADTDEGWDLALGEKALEPALPGFPAHEDLRAIGQERPLDVVPAAVAPPGDAEGWVIAETEGNQALAVGYVIVEGIQLVPPAAQQVDGTWQAIDLDGSAGGWVEATVAGRWALVSVRPSGPSVLIDNPTGEAQLRIDGPAWVVRAP